MKKNLPINLLSTYRAPLMGIAIIFIMICHNSITFGGDFEETNMIIKSFFQVGVDIFFMMSGIGCYFSLSRNPDTVAFYQKRILKIIPLYLVINIVYCTVKFIFKTPIKELFEKHLLISFWINDSLAEWFISSIIAVYLFFPLLYKLINKNESVFKALIFATVIVCLVISIFPDFKLYIINEIFFSRIPVLLIGIYFGKIIYNKREISFSITGSAVVLIISIIAFTVNMIFNNLNPWTVSRLIFIFPAVTISLLMGKYFSRFYSSKILKWLTVLGTFTLEIYLIHEKILFFIVQITDRFMERSLPQSIIINISAAVIAIFCGYYLHKYFEKITDKLLKSK